GEMVNGKVGNVVFYQLNGETFVKTAQQRTSNSWTEAQQLHRKRFKEASGLWRKIKYSQIPGIWNLGAQKMNGYALFIKTNLPAFATDGSIIDVRMLQFSTGRLPLPQEFTAQRKVAGEPLITATWQNKSQPKGERLEDELMVICSTGDAYTDMMATTIRRKDLGGAFALPVINVPIKHVYLFFASSKRNEYSESVCFEV
ncbi:MAG TPA: hypothetical protein VK205_12380, partial [Prolixibacteraceae bacterium]|nr:hypothetical protein [Prolixibacteraceae bacterium]